MEHQVLQHNKTLLFLILDLDHFDVTLEVTDAIGNTMTQTFQILFQ
jgi:hypothetical protein